MPPIMPPPIMQSVVPPGSRAPIIPPCIMVPMPTRPMTARAVHSTASELNTQSAVRSPFSMVVSLQHQCMRDRGRHTDAGVPERSDTDEELTAARDRGDSCGLVYSLAGMGKFHAIRPGWHHVPPT